MPGEERLGLRFFLKPCGHLTPEGFHVEVKDRGDVEGEELGDQQAAHHRHAQGPAGFGPGPKAQGDGQGAHQGRHGGHHDGPEADQGPGIDGLPGAFAFAALGLQGEVDHHDGVFLDDPHQHDHAHKGVDVQVHMKEHQGQQGPHPGGRQAREDGHGVDEALVEDAQDHVDDQDGHDQQEPQALHGGLEGLGRALELVVMVAGNICRATFSTAATASPRAAPGFRLKEMVTAGQLAHVVDGQGAQVPGQGGQGVQGHQLAAGGTDIKPLQGRGVDLILSAPVP